MFQPNSVFGAFEKDNRIAFLPGWIYAPNGNFDIYDIGSSIWSIGVLPQNIGKPTIISVNNIIYVAGGLTNVVQVWKLEF